MSFVTSKNNATTKANAKTWASRVGHAPTLTRCGTSYRVTCPPAFWWRVFTLLSDPDASGIRLRLKARMKDIRVATDWGVERESAAKRRLRHECAVEGQFGNTD